MPFSPLTDLTSRAWTSGGPRSPARIRNDDAPGGGTSFVGLGTVLIAVIVLVVLAATISGYIVRRMRRKAEGSDSGPADAGRVGRTAIVRRLSPSALE